MYAIKSTACLVLLGSSLIPVYYDWFRQDIGILRVGCSAVFLSTVSPILALSYMVLKSGFSLLWLLCCKSVSISTTIRACLIPLVEHFNLARTSYWLTAYLLVEIVFSCIRWRTLRLLDAKRTAALARIFALIALLCIESISKKPILRKSVHGQSAEELAPLISRLLFLWITPLLFKGFRSKLVMSDLDEIPLNLDPANTSRRISIAVQTVKLSDYSGEYTLLWSLWKAFRVDVAFLLAICTQNTILLMVQPLIIRKLILWLQ